jgi:hypothetical protein
MPISPGCRLSVTNVTFNRASVLGSTRRSSVFMRPFLISEEAPEEEPQQEEEPEEFTDSLPNK